MSSKKEVFKYIMGIQSYASHDSGACIIKASAKGDVLEYIAISEERLIRKKYPYVFPVHSIGYCMDRFGLRSLDEIDLLMTDHIRIERWFNSGPTYHTSDYDYLKMKFDIDPRKIRTITHHMAHAASVYYTSGFDEAAILVVDGNGSDLETTSYFIANGDELRLMENYKRHGIGACYTVVTTRILGFGTGGEGKTMGLAPYGEGYLRVLSIDARLEGIKNDFSAFMSRMPYSDVLNQLDPKYRKNPLKKDYKTCQKKEDLLKPYFARAAFDVQKETEKVLVHLARDLRSKTGSGNLCVSGGVGLNSVSNKIMLDKAGFERIFVFPACSDSGIPFGLAVWGYYNCAAELGIEKKKKIVMTNASTGMAYNDAHTVRMCEKYGIPHSQADIGEIARYIANGKIVGWVQGGSEYGPRALGARSILADSRNKDMKEILNSRVKHRESFRPYAPSILREHASEYFDLDCESPYMLLIAKVKKPDVIPAVTHVDRTARVQTVTRESNSVFYDLIKEFHKITGVPCLLNTSFNDAGEPIVETPEDAVIRFLSTEMDYLVIGARLFDKNSFSARQCSKIAGTMTRDRQEAMRLRTEELKERLFSGYNDAEKDFFIAESNKIAEWYTKYKCKYELEKKVLEWLKGKKRILIVGTEDHTAILPKYINYFCLVDIAGFCGYKGLCDSFPASVQYKEFSLEDIGSLDFDEVLVSSYEYNFEIMEHLSGLKLAKPVYAIYDNTSRNFMETFENFPQFKYVAERNVQKRPRSQHNAGRRKNGSYGRSSDKDYPQARYKRAECGEGDTLRRVAGRR